MITFSYREILKTAGGGEFVESGHFPREILNKNRRRREIFWNLDISLEGNTN